MPANILALTPGRADSTPTSSFPHWKTKTRWSFGRRPEHFEAKWTGAEERPGSYRFGVGARRPGGSEEPAVETTVDEAGDRHRAERFRDPGRVIGLVVGDHRGTEPLEKYMGAEGVSITHLRPAGIAKIGSRRMDVVSEGTYIDKDKKLKVIAVEGNRVVVREMESAT